jgi:hypothetical protein
MGNLAQAFTFSTDSVRGSFDSTLTLGGGVRTESQSDELISPLYNASFNRIGGGRLGQASGINDQGNLNYDKGDLFTQYIKGSHELLLRMPDYGLAFMARGTWLYDFAATDTTGTRSGQAALTSPDIGSDGLSSDARKDMQFKARLLDLWVSKSFELGGQSARVRVGNQVISWGESLYEAGGINTTNAYDINRLLQPGTQLKEAVLPAPIISLSSGLGDSFNIELYTQHGWQPSYLPPVGSYWASTSTGEGRHAYNVYLDRARDGGQWGVALRYQPQSLPLSLGLFVVNYHDTLPQVTVDLATGQSGRKYLESRRMYGISANFPVGDWAIGTELSYRPKDAVSLNGATGCAAQGGECWVDQKRYQWHLTSIYALQPGNAGGALLNLLGAEAANLLTETVVIRYPDLKSSYDGTQVSAGGWLWGNEYLDLVQSGGVINSPGDSVGTRNSGGINIDFNWTYDGSLIPGWQVTPGIYVRRGLFGQTPNVSSQFMKGVTSTNYSLKFVQNPADWQFSLNYTRFSGGDSPLDNPLRDRDFVGFALSRNF